jgi:arylsulfatase A-like enzyme
MRLMLSAVLLLSSLTASAAPPNIVFIVGDDQAWTDYGFMGHPHIQTPHLDKLASESLRFDHGYVPTSLCRASLATMITGLYPHQHTITSNDPPIPKGVKPADLMKNDHYLADRKAMVAQFEKSPNLPKLLGESGYVSLQAGKWWEGNACRCGGFTEGMTHGDPSKGGRHGDEGLNVGRQGLKGVTDFIDTAKKDGKPFFVWYAPMMPHQPHNPPDRLFKKYVTKTDSEFVAKYWAMCEWFDETVGDVLAHLEMQKLSDNTIVIYLHDNGWIQDSKKNQFAPKSKRSPYDGGIRTPILVRWPGVIKPGKSEALAHSIDLVPTALVAAGLKPTADMPGLNLLEAKAVAARTSLFGEIFEHNAIDITKPAANLQYRWVIDGQMKLILPNPARLPDAKAELYDLKTDQKEESNLAEKRPDDVTRLTKKLNDWWPAK